MSQNRQIIRLQIGSYGNKKTHRITLPQRMQRKLEKATGRTFEQGEPWQIEYLPDEQGYKISPLE